MTRTRPAVVSLALLTLCAAAIPLSAQQSEDELVRPPVSPNIIEVEPATESRERADALCPCFDIQELVALSAHSSDLCRRDGLLIQVTRWVGNEVPPEGRFGYHILASLPNPRSGSGSCQYFLRDSTDHEVRTLLRRWPSLEAEQAETCFEMMTRWIEGPGGCRSQSGEPEEPDDAFLSDLPGHPDRD